MIFENYIVTGSERKIIFEFSELHKKVAHSIIWEQDIQYVEKSRLILTPYNGDTEKIYYNVSGKLELPGDVYYSKIEIESLDSEAAGIIIYEEITSTQIEQKDLSVWENFLNNTRLQLFTISGQDQLFDLIPKEKIYEYVVLFYTTENNTSDNNKLSINNSEYFAAPAHWAAIPGKAIDYNANISKEDNVRLDVYLRYWVDEPGERV